MTTRRNRRQGFTLIELVIAVAIASILVTLAMPSFKTFLRNTELKSASESIHQGLQLARAEAVRLNNRTRFVITANTSWTVVNDTTGATIQSKPAKEGAPNTTLTFTPTAGTRVTFNAYGRGYTNTDGSAPITQIDFTASGASISRRIKIEAGGQISVCDPNVGTARDPLKC